MPNPDRERAATSYRFLRDLFSEFPFRDSVDEGVAIAGLLTGLVRSTCGLAPAFLYSSPTQGTGKTTLATLTAAIILGEAPGVSSFPEDEAELEKAIVSYRLTGSPCMLFDNLRQGLGIQSAALAKLLTSLTFQSRILGHNKTVSLSSAVLVLLTGNNVAPRADMASRILECYLDAKTERPDRRKFNRDIIPWALTRRAEIVRAGLTVVRDYMNSGEKVEGAERPTRFQSWDLMVRQPIIWVGGPDIATKTDRAYEDDPSITLLRNLLSTWKSALGTEPLTSNEILSRVEVDSSEEMSEFRTALFTLVGDRRNVALTGQAIGVRLTQFLNRPLDGLAITKRYDSHRKHNVWTVCGNCGDQYPQSTEGIRT